MRFTLVCLCVAVLTMSLSAMAEDGQLATTLAAGLTLTDGNSETLQANASILSEGERKGLGSVRFGFEGNYGEQTVDDQKDTTTENAKIFGNAKKTLSEMTFTYLDASVLYDDIARVNYRAVVGPGAGLYLIKNEATKLSVESGLSYVWEDVDDVKDDYLALRIAQRIDHQLSETAKIWQSAEFLPQIDDFGNYLVTVELGAEAALNSRMNLRFVLQDTYDSEPGQGLKENDVTLICGISIKL